MTYRKIVFNFIVMVILWVFAGPYVWATPQSGWTPKNWSIVVTSCDKYSALWGPFFTLLERSWPELNSTNSNMGVYLIANTQHYNSDRVKTIHIPNERSWSDNMLTALEQIDSKYILFFEESYWITKFDQQRLMELMKRLEEEDAAYMDLWDGYAHYFNKGQKPHKIEGVVYKGKFESYRTSLQVGLWEKKALQQLLRRDEDIWTFEPAASIRSSGYPKPFLGVVANPPIRYLDATYQGYITPAALELAQQQGIHFFNTMPVLGKYNWGLTWKDIKRKVAKVRTFFQKNTIGGKNSYSYSFQDQPQD